MEDTETDLVATEAHLLQVVTEAAVEVTVVIEGVVTADESDALEVGVQRVDMPPEEDIRYTYHVIL